MDRKQHVSSIVTDSSWPTLQDMYSCYDEFKHNKKYSYTRINFELNLANNISKLYREIHSKTYSLSKSCCFIVTKPKAREIFAASYKDRVMNHLVVKELLKIWTPKFSPHSFACIKNRGLHKTFKYLEKRLLHLNRREKTKEIYVLKLDVKTFFPTVHRPTIYKLLMNSINKTSIFPTEKLNTLKYLTDVILQHDARSNFFISKHDISLSKYLNPDKSWINQDQNHGMPIGDLISQLCANIVLTELDHYISRTLSPSIYLRYVDDLLLLDKNKDALYSFIEKIDTWLQTKRYQCLNKDKIILCPLSKRVPFLGYIISNRSSSHKPLLIEIPRQKIWNLVTEAQKLEKHSIQEPQHIGGNICSFPIDKEPLLFQRTSYLKSYQSLCKINSMLGWFKHARTFKLKRHILRKLAQSESFNKYCNIRSDFGSVQAFKDSTQRPSCPRVATAMRVRASGAK